MQDKKNPQGVFVGANDNAGGVALLMELARDIPDLKSKYGIDFLLIDGEEFIFAENDPMFLGADYFAREYAKKKTDYRYRWGVLLDMIAGKNLQLYEERNSVGWKDTAPLVRAIWSTANKLKVREFIPRPKPEVEDDHIILHNVGGIPCIDVVVEFGIGTDFPYWHTEGDTPDKCSPLSLAKVGWVLEEWLKTAK